MKNTRVNNVLKIVRLLFISVCLFSSVALIFFGIKLNIIPAKFLILVIMLLIILNLIFIYCIYKKGKFLKIISIILMTLLAMGSCVLSIYSNNTYNFISNTNNKYDTLTYSVIVLKNSNYNKLKDLDGKSISLVNDTYKNQVEEYIHKKISFTEDLSSDFSDIADNLFENKVDAIVLEESSLILVNEEVKDFQKNTRVIDTIEVKVKSFKENSNISISNEPFIIYISGIDQYGNINSVRGRSDVNQLLVINPKTYHMLLVNTPRDYYVQLDGTTGLRDKLTHAGIYGIDKSIRTLENLYDTDINHYLRVNFNSLIKVVDVIGGIDIVSDKSFRAHTNKDVYVEEGLNHFNGVQALAYSRERYAYLTGDNHRGENQQQVITAIIKKLTSSKVLISKYSSILNALDGSLETDIPVEKTTSFIKLQLDKMPSWNIESIKVSGFNSSDYTYSMGSKYKLYVMEPDMNSVISAKNKIREVLNEN